ncbi:transposable element Tcb1 transposase [Trichonephila clavipes]|nr:transposable element Tcb1 transposase [Trichonephila clavipes]
MRTGNWQLLPKKQTEHSIRPVSSALFSYRYDSFKANRVRRLGHIVLYARRLVGCVPLTATHCRLRLTWSKEHALWTPQQLSCVMFSDKTRFSLQFDSRWTLIGRAPGTRYHQDKTIERNRYGSASQTFNTGAPFSITIFIAPLIHNNLLNAIIMHFYDKATIFIINRTNS